LVYVVSTFNTRILQKSFDAPAGLRFLRRRFLALPNDVLCISIGGTAHAENIENLGVGDGRGLNRMNVGLRIAAVAGVALLIALALVVQAGPHSHQLDEDAALSLLERTQKKDSVYTCRISLNCVSYDTEETTDGYFQFALCETHNAKCGGDPETNPVVDRYRVYRRSGKLKWFEAVEGNWRTHHPGQIR
jgi:hypothetical protein